MLLGTLGASLSGNLLKTQLELVRIFNATSSFNKLSNTKV